MSIKRATTAASNSQAPTSHRTADVIGLLVSLAGAGIAVSTWFLLRHVLDSHPNQIELTDSAFATGIAMTVLVGLAVYFCEKSSRQSRQIKNGLELRQHLEALVQDQNFKLQEMVDARQETAESMIRVLKRSQIAAINIMDDLSRERQELQRTNRHLIMEISERRRVEAECDRVIAELERSNGELDEARRKALVASDAKSRFLANVSHEIRTPLTAIIGFTESVLAASLSPAEQRAALLSSLRNGQHLLRLLDDILCVSKIEADKLIVDSTRFSLAELLDELATSMKLRALEKGIRFEIECHYPLPAHITSDPTRFKQILYNLAANALKFTLEGSVIVKVRWPAGTEQLLIDVVDTGIGIAPHAIERLFKPFSQVDESSTRRFGGSGLGLAISKQLVERLGGELGVESLEGQGSTFSFCIATGPIDESDIYTEAPPRSATEAAATYESPEAPKLSGSILIVDDAPDNRELLQLLLRELSLTSVSVPGGHAALQAVEAQSFDMILMDMHMPIMDGYETVEELRKRGYTNPIIAVTASAIDDALERCLAIGCNAYLRKPFACEELYDLMGRYLVERSETDPLISTLIERRPELTPAVVSFIDKLPARVQALEERSRAQDWAEVRSIAHVLCGAAGFGYDSITSAARAIQSAVGHANEGAVEHEIRALKALARRALLGRPASSPGEAGSFRAKQPASRQTHI